MWLQLKAKTKIINPVTPGSGPGSARNYRFLKEMTARTVPRGVPGEGVLNTRKSCGCKLRESEVRSGSFGSIGGRLGAQRNQNLSQTTPYRTSDNFKLQPHELQPHPYIDRQY